MFTGVNAWKERVLKVANLFFQCFINVFQTITLLKGILEFNIYIFEIVSLHNAHVHDHIFSLSAYYLSYYVMVSYYLITIQRIHMSTLNSQQSTLK